ncbi:hypothetical protein CQW32_28335 [Pseudomonas putida]|jgi:hypothetical protein|uniref:hypothetical protein n=1 Tax=Pseudomonas putida TaxID=303 RepID=UPI000C2B4E89|nr:hypothetical protein [Pseudomonas putida]MBF8160829.1 hypothetical protein [Pseudomonas mendocina]PJX07046.1 hypothetical protein CQW32_28335 [Pseudomonas putida]HCF5435995.1 hypothetical protein [Pseudomonas aeruginosa]
MIDLGAMRDSMRNAAAAEIFSHMASEERANALAERIRSLPDHSIDLMARLSGVPESQYTIHRAMIRGEDNPFIDSLKGVDGLLQTGDVILMTGMSPGSQALASGQKLLYENARSSHVAVVHADFICIDAMPKIGTTNRIVTETLQNTESNWRVIRCKKVLPVHQEAIARACAFYLAQPYKILPSKKAMKRFSYCSELARKIYSDCEISGVGIPNNIVVKPADFDKLADGHPQWDDITERVRPAIEFCGEYPELVKVAAKLFIDGLKLNRRRFEERTAMLADIQKAAKAGRISRERAQEMTRDIRAIEGNMNHTFWDVRRSV